MLKGSSDHNIKNDVFKRSSKTYYLSSLLFPSKVRDDVVTLYAFVRVADNFVDDVPPRHKALQQLRLHTSYLLKNTTQANNKNDYSELSANDKMIIEDFCKMVQVRKIPYDYVYAFLAAMESDINPQPKNTMDELNSYMYGSAEVIGLMLCHMFYDSEYITQNPDCMTRARDLGRSMQLINFARDVSEDFELGRQYIPADLLLKHHLSDLSPASCESVAYKEVLDEFLNAYDIAQKDARNGFHHLPYRIRLAVMTANDGYNWTMHKIKQNYVHCYRYKQKPTAAYIMFRAFLNIFLALRYSK